MVKNKWQRVAKEVNKEGYQFSAEQCRLTIKGLKSKYDRQKKKNNTSGESLASDDDEEEYFDVFEKIPDMKPRAVLDSGSSKKRPPADDSSSDEVEHVPGSFIFYAIFFINILLGCVERERESFLPYSCEILILKNCLVLISQL